MARASARLRTTCLCTWLSGGTSITTSPRSMRLAGKPAPRLEAALLVIALLDRRELGEMVGAAN